MHDWTRFLPQLVRRRLEGRMALQRIIANTGWLFADNVVRMCVGLLVSVWVARYLGPERFGVLNYALAFVALFSSLATLGLDGIVVRDIVRDPSCRDETLGSACALKFAGGVLVVVATVCAIMLLRPTDSLTHWLVGITALGTVFQATDAIGFWFQSQIRSKYAVYAKNAAFLAVALAKVVLIFAKAPLIAFAWAGLAEIVLASAGMVVAYRAQGLLFSAWRATMARSRSLIRDSWPLIFAGIAIYIQARFDQVMLGEMVGDHELGQYSAAMKLIEVFGFIPMVIQNSVAPTIASAKLAGEDFYYNRLCNVYRLMFILFLLAAVPIFLFSTQIVVLLYGEQFRGAGVLLSLFAVRLFFANFGVAKSLFITNENLFRYSLLTAIAGAAVNIGLNFLLIPRYASVGAIWSMIVSFFVTTFLIDVCYADVRRNLRTMIKAILTPWKLTFR